MHMHINVSQISFFLFQFFCSLDIWVGFKVVLAISYNFVGALSMQRKGKTSKTCVCIADTNYNSRYSVLMRFLVTKHVCNIFEVEIVLTC